MVTIDRNGKEIDEIEVYENKIEEWIQDYCDRHGVDDMSVAKQSQWNAALLHVFKHVFKNPNSKSLYKSCLDYKNGNLLNSICDIYINLCYCYNKEVSMMGYSKLTGIDSDTVVNWGNGTYRAFIYYDKDNNIINDIETFRINHKNEYYRQEANTTHLEIFKKLVKENEESLSNKLISGDGPTVGLLGALNRRHGWNMGQPRETAKAISTASREQIGSKYQDAEKPRLPDFDND